MYGLISYIMDNFGIFKTMKKKKTNILVVGLLSTGSSAAVDLLREYDNINVIPNEFNDFKAPSLVADQLSYKQSNDFQNKIETLTKFKSKIRRIYNILPILTWKIDTIKGVRGRFIMSLIRIRQLILLKRLNRKLSSDISLEDKIRFANQWITDVGNINGGNNEFIVFDQPLASVIDNYVWKEVFYPWKLIIVYRDPKDQLAEIIRNGKLYEPYGAPYVNLGSVIIEEIYGRNRKSALKLHIDSIKKRFEWINSLKKELDSDKFLLIDFEGFVNNYDMYKSVIENFIGEVNAHHKKYKKYFDPINAEKSIGIYKEYLSSDEIESLKDLETWYSSMIKNQI